MLSGIFIVYNHGNYKDYFNKIKLNHKVGLHYSGFFQFPKVFDATIFKMKKLCEFIKFYNLCILLTKKV